MAQKHILASIASSSSFRTICALPLTQGDSGHCWMTISRDLRLQSKVPADSSVIDYLVCIAMICCRAAASVVDGRILMMKLSLGCCEQVAMMDQNG